MKLTLELSPAQINAIARRLNAQADGLGYAAHDDDIAIDTLTRLVCQAAGQMMVLLAKITTPIDVTVERAHSTYRPSRRAIATLRSTKPHSHLNHQSR